MEPPPRASRKCPTCREPITFRKNQAGDGVLLRADQVDRFDAGKRAHFERRRMIHELRALYVSEAEYGAAEREVEERHGSAFVPGDVFWWIANKAVIRALASGDWNAAEMAYRAQATRLHAEGKSHWHVTREAFLAALRSWASLGLREVDIRAGQSCPVCSVDDQRRVTIHAQIDDPSLPHVECPVGWCSCYYGPVYQ